MVGSHQQRRVGVGVDPPAYGLVEPRHVPGCLGLDGLWQLTGFTLGWRGWQGRGYALGVGEVKLKGMVRPDRKMLTYYVDFTKAVQTRRLTMGVANGIVEADGEVIYEVTDMKVALSES